MYGNTMVFASIKKTKLQNDNKFPQKSEGFGNLMIKGLVCDHE